LAEADTPFLRGLTSAYGDQSPIGNSKTVLQRYAGRERERERERGAKKRHTSGEAAPGAPSTTYRGRYFDLAGAEINGDVINNLAV
jgi:hypothetical protein